MKSKLAPRNDGTPCALGRYDQQNAPPGRAAVSWLFYEGGTMSALPSLDPGQDAAARRRPCPATTRGARRATRNALPADPPRVEEIVAVMRLAGESVYGDRLHGIIVVLCREATCDCSSREGEVARTGYTASDLIGQ